MQGKRIGFALTGSFCTFKKVLPQVEALVSAGAEVTPIVSPSVAATDSRFGKAEVFWNELARMTGREPVSYTHLDVYKRQACGEATFT